MSQPTNSNSSPSGEETPKTNYEELLLSLAQSSNPEDELAKTLKPKATSGTPWRNPLAGEGKGKSNAISPAVESLSIQTIFRLATIVQGTLQSELLSRTSPLVEAPELSSEDPETNRKALQAKNNAANIICALGRRTPGGDPIQNWEATARAMSLTELKNRTVVRAALAAESLFARAAATPESQEEMEDAIKLFREASRTFEISLAAKNNTQAGPGKAAAQARGIPPKAVEIISCLTQIAMESLRNHTPPLTGEEEKTLRNFQAQCRRAFGMAYSSSHSNEASQRQSGENLQNLLETPLKDSIPNMVKTRQLWETWTTPEEEPLATEVGKILGALYQEASLSEEGKSILEQAQAKAAQNGFEAEEPNEKEWITIRELEKIHTRLENDLQKTFGENIPTTAELLQAQSPLTLRVFAALRRETVGLGKASQMVLAGKILGLKANQAKFQKAEVENPDATLEGFGFIQETKTLQQEAGRTLSNSGFGPHDRNQLEELADLANDIDYAESILFSPSVRRTLHSQRRTEAERAARAVLNQETRGQGMEPELEKVHSRVEKTLATIEAEFSNHGTALENLPKMLRDHEVSQTLNGAIARLIQGTQRNVNELQLILDDPETKPAVKNAANSLLEIAHRTQGEEGIEPKELSDINKNVTTNALPDRESLGKIIANLCEGRGIDGAPAEIDEVAKLIGLKHYDNQREEIPLEEAEKLVRNENLKTHKDSEAPFANVKTGILAEVVRITNDREASKALRLRYQNRFLRDIRTIRRWRDKTTGMDRQETIRLAVALCQTPNSIRQACGEQIRKNIETCTQPPSWNDHSSMPNSTIAAALGRTNQNYSILRASFKEERNPNRAEKELMGLLQKLQALTEEIHQKSPSRFVRGELLAEALADKAGELRRSQLDAIAKLTEVGPKSQLIQPAIEFLHSWSEYTGNRDSVVKNAILLPEERKNKDRVTTPSYLAVTLETHSTNLRTLRDYMKAVVDSPEALAETYLQHERAQKDREANTEPFASWEAKMNKTSEQCKSEAEQLEEEIENMTNLFETKVEEAKKSDNELAKEEFLDPRFHRAFESLLSQKKRDLQNLYLRAHRIEQLVNQSKGETSKPDAVKETLQEATPEENVENTLARALDAALMAKQQKLTLPKTIEPEPEVGAGEILNASLAQQRLQIAKDTLAQAATKLREVNPKAQEIIEKSEKSKDPTEICNQLKEMLFEAVKNCEMVAAQSHGREQDVNPVLTKLKAKLLAENPDLETEQRKWRATLNSTLKHLHGACQELEEKPQPKPSRGKKTPEVQPTMG